MRLQVSLLVLVASLFALGCGSSSSSGGEDPAASIPAGTPVYVEAAIRPEGAQGDAARALLKKFLPPGKTLESLLDDASRKQGKGIVFSRDVEPWLGEKVAFGVSDLTAGSPSFVGAADVTDADKATTFLKRQGARKGSYKGADLYLDDDKNGADPTWAAVHGGVIVFADGEAGVKRGLDAQDNKPLSESKTFKDALAELPGERLGALYVDAEGLRRTLEARAKVGAPEKAIIDKLLGDGKLKPITGALTATPSSATLETRFNGSGLARLASLGLLGTGRSTELVKEAPADAFAVFGASNLGKTVQDAVATYAGAFGGAALTSQLQSSLGIDLQRDVFSWVGDVAVFARGSTTKTINGALVISATNPAAARAALPRLMAAVGRSGAAVARTSVDGADLAYSIPAPGAPGPVVVALKDDRVVAGFGRAAATAALSPSAQTLDGSGRYAAAKKAVDGILPSLIVSIPGVLQLVDGSVSSPGYARARPYLEKLDQVVTGSEKDGDSLRSLITVTTK